MAGTVPSLFKNTASVMAASALIPARSSSLFFVGCAKPLARCFSASSTRYSALGIVKLSRTSFGFLALSAFMVLVTTSGWAVCLGNALLRVVVTPADVRAAETFLAAIGLANTFAIGLTANAFLVAGERLTFLAGAGRVAGEAGVFDNESGDLLEVGILASC